MSVIKFLRPAASIRSSALAISTAEAIFNIHPILLQFELIRFQSSFFDLLNFVPMQSGACVFHSQALRFLASSNHTHLVGHRGIFSLLIPKQRSYFCDRCLPVTDGTDSIFLHTTLYRGVIQTHFSRVALNWEL